MKGSVGARKESKTKVISGAAERAQCLVLNCGVCLVLLLSQRVGAALRSGLAHRVLFVSVLTESVIFVVFSLRHITCNT